MELYDVLKPLIFNNEKINSHFADFVGLQLLILKDKALHFTVSDLMLAYCSVELGGLSRVHKILRSLDSDFTSEILQHKDFPNFKDFKDSIPSNWKHNKSFSIIEGLIILESYGNNEHSGINERYKLYRQKLKAKKQSENLLKKDLNGLLGVSNLFKKNIESDSNWRKSNSVWTVKKK